MTEEERRPKQTAFRLPQKTLDILDKMVEDGKARTRTDALILAVDTVGNYNLTERNMLVSASKEIEELNERINRMKKQLDKNEELIKNIPVLIEEKIRQLQL